MQSAKETATNVGASAKAGMEKTKAAVQEKVEKMTAHDPAQKEMATQKKEERKAQAELDKQAAKQAASGTGAGTYSHSTTGATGHTTGHHQMSAVPGHGTGQPVGAQVTEGAAGVNPIGVNTGDTTAQNPRAGSGTTGYST